MSSSGSVVDLISSMSLEQFDLMVKQTDQEISRSDFIKFVCGNKLLFLSDDDAKISREDLSGWGGAAELFDVVALGREKVKFSEIFAFLSEMPEIVIFKGFNFETKLSSSVFSGISLVSFFPTGGFTDPHRHKGKIRKIRPCPGFNSSLPVFFTMEESSSAVSLWYLKKRAVAFLGDCGSSSIGNGNKKNFVDGQQPRVQSVAWAQSPDKTLGILYSNGKIELWGVGKSKELASEEFSVGFVLKLSIDIKAPPKVDMGRLMELFWLTRSESWLISDITGSIFVWKFQQGTSHSFSKFVFSHVLRIHSDFLTDFAETNDRLLIVASADRTISIWDTRNWSLESHLREPQASVLSIAFVSDPCNVLVAAGCCRSLYAWNVSDRAYRGFKGKMEGHQVNVIRVSSLGRMICSLDERSIIRVWNAATLSFLFSFQHPASAKVDTILIPCAGRILLGGMKLYSYTGSREASDLVTKDGLATSISSSTGDAGVASNNKMTLTGNAVKIVWAGISTSLGQCYSITSQGDVCVHDRITGDSRLLYKCFSGDDNDSLIACEIIDMHRLLVIATRSGSVVFLRLVSGYPIAAYSSGLAAHRMDMKTEFSPVIATPSAYKGVRSIRKSSSVLEETLHKNNATFQIPGECTCMAVADHTIHQDTRNDSLSDDDDDSSSVVLVGCSDGSVVIFTARHGRFIRSFKMVDEETPSSFAFLQRTFLVGSGTNPRIFLYRIYPFRLIQSLDLSASSTSDLASISRVLCPGPPWYSGGLIPVDFCYAVDCYNKFCTVKITYNGNSGKIFGSVNLLPQGMELATDPYFYAVVKTKDMFGATIVTSDTNRYLAVADSEGLISVLLLNPETGRPNFPAFARHCPFEDMLSSVSWTINLVDETHLLVIEKSSSSKAARLLKMEMKEDDIFFKVDGYWGGCKQELSYSAPEIVRIRSGDLLEDARGVQKELEIELGERSMEQNRKYCTVFLTEDTQTSLDYSTPPSTTQSIHKAAIEEDMKKNTIYLPKYSSIEYPPDYLLSKLPPTSSLRNQLCFDCPKLRSEFSYRRSPSDFGISLISDDEKKSWDRIISNNKGDEQFRFVSNSIRNLQRKTRGFENSNLKIECDKLIMRRNQ